MLRWLLLFGLLFPGLAKAEGGILVFEFRPSDKYLAAQTDLSPFIKDGLSRGLEKSEIRLLGLEKFPTDDKAAQRIMRENGAKAGFKLSTQLGHLSETNLTAIQISMEVSRIGVNAGIIREKITYKGPYPCDRACLLATTQEAIPHIARKIGLQMGLSLRD